MPSPGLLRHQTSMCYTYIHAGKALTHTISKSNFKNSIRIKGLPLTSFKLEMRPEEELESPKRFSIVVRLLLK